MKACTVLLLFIMNSSYIIYGGTLLVVGTLMYGAYYFGSNISWKSDTNKACQDILQNQKENFKLLVRKIALVDGK